MSTWIMRDHDGLCILLNGASANCFIWVGLESLKSEYHNATSSRFISCRFS
jgi:hypothetical protein